MKYSLAIISLFTLVLTTFSNLTFAESKAKIQVRTQEIIIDDDKLSSLIFNKLNVKAQRFEQIVGVYKLGKYAYCRTHLKNLRCYLYLSLDFNGNFSSPWTDPDFGKGDAIDYIYNKTKTINSHYIFEGEHVYIWFHGNSAQIVFDKMSAAKINYDDKNREVRQGEHLVCALSKDNLYACFMKLPLNNVIDPEKEPQVIWDMT